MNVTNYLNVNAFLYMVGKLKLIELRHLISNDVVFWHA